MYPVLTESEFGTLYETPTAHKSASRLYAEYIDAIKVNSESKTIPPTTKVAGIPAYLS